MNCSQCGRMMDLAEENHPLWKAYVCRPCAVVTLKLKKVKEYEGKDS